MESRPLQIFLLQKRQRSRKKLLWLIIVISCNLYYYQLNFIKPVGPVGMEGPMAVSHGKEALRQKSQWWQENNEVHGGSVEGPYVNGDQFAVRFTFDITPKATDLKAANWRNYYDKLGWKTPSERGCLPFRVWQIYKQMVAYAAHAAHFGEPPPA